MTPSSPLPSSASGGRPSISSPSLLSATAGGAGACVEAKALERLRECSSGCLLAGCSVSLAEDVFRRRVHDAEASVEGSGSNTCQQDL